VATGVGRHRDRLARVLADLAAERITPQEARYLLTDRERRTLADAIDRELRRRGEEC
jgi:hypothetical protein